MSGTPRLLFVDDELAVQRAFARSLQGLDLIVECVNGVTDAIAAMRTREYSVVVTDMTMTDGSGLDVLNAMSVHLPTAARLVLSGDIDVVQVLSGTPVDVILNKPWDVNRLRRVVADAVALAASRAKAP